MKLNTGATMKLLRRIIRRLGFRPQWENRLSDPLADLVETADRYRSWYGRGFYGDVGEHEE